MARKPITVKQRFDVWEIASKMVAPIIEQHDLEVLTTGNAFTNSFKTSKVEQHIEHILKVADWLMDRDLSG